LENVTKQIVWYIYSQKELKEQVIKSYPSESHLLDLFYKGERSAWFSKPPFTFIPWAVHFFSGDGFTRIWFKDYINLNQMLARSKTGKFHFRYL